MRKEIDRVLGNSLRCILPSYWWKRLLGMLADRVESAQDAAGKALTTATMAALEAENKQPQLVSGSNIKTINHQSILGSGNIIVDTDKVEKYRTKDDLDANGSLAGGDIAAVVDELLTEKPFTECYQPTRSEIEATPYNKKFTKVDGISLNPDFNPSLISSNYGSLRVKLYSDGNSKGYYKEYPSRLEIECDYNRQIFCWEYGGTSGSGHRLYDSSGFHASAIDIVNNILREGDFRFSYFEVTYRVNVSDPGYTYYYSYNNTFPADATAMINNVVKMLFAETQNADIYLRSAEWVKLLKEGDVTGGGADVIIDSEISDTSTNAVQNKAVKAYVDEKVANVGGTTIREFYTGDSLTEQQKAWNLETFQLFQENKCFIVLDSGSGLLPLSWHAGRSFVFQYGMINTVTLNYEITVSEDGSTTTRNVNYLPDEELSTTSANVVTNRAVTTALNNKADKSDIKTLNGVSLLGGGNLQLGDGQTIVYDDSAVYERIAEVEELAAQAKVSSELAVDGLNMHLEEVNEVLFEDVSSLMKQMDELAAELRALTSRVKALEDK